MDAFSWRRVEYPELDLVVREVRYDWTADGHRGPRRLSAVKQIAMSDLDRALIADAFGSEDGYFDMMMPSTKVEMLAYAARVEHDVYMSTCMHEDGFRTPMVVSDVSFDEGEG